MRDRFDLAGRGAGIVALGVAGLTSLAHRAYLETHPAQAVSGWEAVLGLVSFIAAMLGVLLLIHGRRLLRPMPPPASLERPARATRRSRARRG